MKRVFVLAAAILVASAASSLAADDPTVKANPVPATRPQLKASLEAIKARQPRIPLPPAIDGDTSLNDARMRAHYLPLAWGGGQRSGGTLLADAKLDELFSDPSFWIVSRANNCQYCLGHQELRLRAAGMDDDTIAALDTDWSPFNPGQQAALKFARKLTLEPHLVSNEDIAELKKNFSDPQIIQLTFNIARFNAMNRWTEALGLPQEHKIGNEALKFDTPTSEQYHETASVAAPTTRSPRPPLPTLDYVFKAISACIERNARVALPLEDGASGALGTVERRTPFNWQRVLSAQTGASYVTMLNTIMTDEHLPVRLKAELALVSAVHNRAWYAVGHAAHRLRTLGVSPEEMAALFDVFPLPPGEGQGEGKPPIDDASNWAAAHQLAAKLTANPHQITDADIARVRERFSDRETAQIVHVIAVSNMFDRFTEALGLPLEDGVCE
jgi:alkylhydroperoxidase family enzyme